MGTGDQAHLAARRTKAIELKRSGFTYQQIADQMAEHYHGDKAAAYMDISRALAQHRAELAESVEMLRQIEDERDDGMRRTLYAILAGRHPLIQGGKVVTDRDGNPVRDFGPNMAAIDRLGRISERYSKRHGLDASPSLTIAFEQRTDLEATVVVEAILAGLGAINLDPRQRMVALEAAQAKLSAIDGEVISDTGDPA